MDGNEVRQIELSLGFSLPEAYRSLLLNFPEQLTELYPADHAADERRLFNTAEPIISANTSVRAAGHRIDPDDPDSRWPDEYLIIGMDLGTNLYCLNRGQKRSRVYFWFHEDGQFESYAKNLAEFVQKLIRVYGQR